jgi:diaminohydroxyphosphoribosylaminopyrimidine deaminase/5-amino-6-(5-phosphoribosylamino)uracil reductase
MKFTQQESSYMQLAVSLAWLGWGKTQPNPLVGAVVVRDGEVVGEGYHIKFGGAHAEVNALKMAGAKARGADLYVTLDPCRHTGKTGPCTEVIIKSGVRRVVSAIGDPHDVRHEGEKMLKKAGVIFQRGLLKEASREALQFYLKNVVKKMPYVILKVATTMDGKVATSTGFSRGITGKESQKFVHLMRSNVDGLLTGGGTIVADNPHMGVRLVKGNDPLRVLLDSNLEGVDLSAEYFRDSNVLVFTTKRAPLKKVDMLRSRDIEVVVMPSLRDLPGILRLLLGAGRLTPHGRGWSATHDLIH